jgi:hypothetical protein
MARTRRRHAYRKSKRWNPSCMNPRKDGTRTAAEFREFQAYWKDKAEHHPSKYEREFARETLGLYGRRGRRRNPSGGQLSDGTVVAVSGNFVTLHSPYGEAYDYDGVDHHTLARVRKAKTFSKASSMLSKHCILRSINPNRSDVRRRKYRSRGGERHGRIGYLSGRLRRKANRMSWGINPGRKKGRRKAHPATRKGRHSASRLRSTWKKRTRHGGRYAHLGAVVRTDKHGRIHAGRKKHVKGVSWTGRKGTVALYSRSTGKLWGTNPRRRRKHHKRRRR